MALGGGSFVTHNKILPGAYMNFVSAANANASLSERGSATIPLALDWGPLGSVFEVSAGELLKNSVPVFGFDYSSPQLKPLRDLFKNVRSAFIFRLGSGGVRAANAYGTAKYPGVRGNDLAVCVAINPDDSSKKDVSVLLDKSIVASQTVSAASELIDDAFVSYNKSATLTPTVSTPFSGGTNPTVTNADFQAYLDAIEGYSFNAIGCPSDVLSVKQLFAAFTKRMRDEKGVKFQCVVHDLNADYEGVINVFNPAAAEPLYAPVYWVTGVAAGTAVNKSALNKLYDGEYELNVAYTQSALENAISNGGFAFHRVNGDAIRVLADINSLVSLSPDKNEVFKENQTIRVVDQIANDIAVIFNTRYLGSVPNDNAGRISLWSDIVRHHEQLQAIRAIEDFDGGDVSVTQGDTKRSVVVADSITVANAMAQLYMTITIA